MSKNRVFVVRNGLQINVNLNGKSYFVNSIDEEDAKKVMDFVKEVQLDPSNDNVARLEGLISPTAKLSQNAYLEKDRSGNWYLKGYNVPMPQDLVERILQFLEDNLPIEALVNFWKLCLLNPDEEARHRLFKFASTYGFPITPAGYFIAYKSVAFKGVQKRDFAIKISQAFLDMKAYGKRNPKDFIVFEWGSEDNLVTEIMDQKQYDEFRKEHIANYQIPTEEYETFLKEKDIMLLANLRQLRQTNLLDKPYSVAVKETALEYGYTEEEPVERWKRENNFKHHGNLTDLFTNIAGLFEDSEQLFTDWHTKKSTIKIGEPVTMRREDCDCNHNNTCSRGLHVGSTQYVSKFGYDPNKDYIIACLVSPADVVAIPEDYSWQKMRTCRYYPYAICERNEDGSIVEIDTKYFEEDYIAYEKEALEESLKELGRLRIEGDLDIIDEAVIKERESFTKSRLIDIS